MEQKQEEIEVIPEKIADIVFNLEPDNNTKFQIYCHNDLNDNFGLVNIFEVMTTIFVEGMFKKIKNPYDINEETILSLNPWLNMLGFKICVEKFNKDDKNKVSDFYSWIILKDDPTWKQYFELSNIDKKYSYILGGESPYKFNKECTLKNLFAKFSFNNQEIYKISFKFVI
jgi:hypothetical protein